MKNDLSIKFERSKFDALLMMYQTETVDLLTPNGNLMPILSAKIRFTRPCAEYF